MSRTWLNVGFEIDPNTNSVSFSDRAKQLTLETGEYVLNPDEAIFNKKTGEVIEYPSVVVTEKEYKDRKRKEYFRKKLKNKEYAKYGTFLFLVFSRVEELFPNLNNKTISMLIMLSSFLDYDNVLRKTNNELMYRKDLAKVLDTSESTIVRFVRSLKAENLLVINKDNTMQINSKRIYRGHIKGKINNANYYTTRIYINSCRELYYSCNKSDRAKLSYIYRLLPWISLEHNILCWNPDETNIDDLKLMSLGDYAEEIGFGRENSTKLSKELFSFKLYGKPVILLVYSGDIKRASVLVNPSLLYSGHDVGYMRKFFDAQAEKADENKVDN